MNADGSGQRRLTQKGAHNFNPAWSPDGKRIAFERGRRQRDYANCSYCAGLRGLAVFVMNADGSGQRKLTQGGSQPQWSPDGRKIAFVSERDGNKDIWVMNADGSRQRNLIRAAGHGEREPASLVTVAEVELRAARSAAFAAIGRGHGDVPQCAGMLLEGCYAED